MSHAEEALRLLTIKRVCLQKDNAMVRAALVLDYLSRNATSSFATAKTQYQYSQITIPITILADAIGFTQKRDINKLQFMQTIVASHLNGTSVDQRRTKGMEGSRKRTHVDSAAQLRDQSDAAAAITTKTPKIKPSSLIQHLCIQLGTMISDAEFVNSYAIRLFSELQTSSSINPTASTSGSSTSSLKRSNYELHKDMERNQMYYEAACFYLAVTKSEGDKSHSLVKGNNKNTHNSTQRKDLKSRKKGDQPPQQGLDEDDAEDCYEGLEDERPLNEMDVIREANLLEGTFRTVLTYVRDWISGVTISLDSELSRNSRSGDTKDASTKRLFVAPDEKDGSKGERGVEKYNPHRNAVFEQWKAKVLHETKMSVLEQSTEGDKQGDWLSLAAEEVLSKAGM